MKMRRVRLAVAIAATLAAPMAHALGLGQITVRSGLNEPLRAEIPLLEVSPEELAGIQTRLASAADFARVGLSAGSVPVPLEFAVVTGAGGRPAIAVTSRDPVREPLVSVLIEVNWSNGRLLREYNILLDPPRVAPAVVAPTPAPAAARPAPVAATTAPAAPEPAPVQPVATAPAAAAPRPAPAPAPAAPAPAAPAPAPAAARPAPATPPTPAAPPAAPSRSDRVTVQSGDTLWEIAQANRPRPTVTVDQMMIAIQRENPQAFIGGNINRIRRGATLAIPEASKVDAISPAAARDEVRAQVAALAAPREVDAAPAAAAAAPASSAATARAGAADSRLEVLPPRAGTDATGTAGERTGTASGTDARRVAQLDADLKRAQEQVASRDQEVRELRSRVGDLEKIDRDRQSLVALKDSDLAALRQQLQQRDAELARLAERIKELEAAKAAAAAAPTPEAAPAPAMPAPAAVAAVEEAPTATSEPAAGPESTGTAEAPVPTAEAETPIEPSAEAVAEAPVEVASAESTEIAADQAEPPTASSFEAEPAIASGDAAPAEPAPAEVAPAAPEGAAEPAPAGTPWWQQPFVLAIAGGAALLLLVAGVVSSRRRKAAATATAATASRSSVAEAFSDDAGDEVEGDAEQRLLEYLATAPNDLDAHLDLLRMYRDEGDLDRFETAANAMYAQVYDPMVPQWQEALAMGRELVPDHPLFAEAGFLESPPPATASEPGDRAEEWEALDATAQQAETSWASEHDVARAEPTAAADLGVPEPSLELEPQRTSPWEGLDEVKVPTADVQPYEQPKTPEVTLDVDFDLEPVRHGEVERGVTPFAEDPIGTKLDLARAYIDMGDLEGARAMLQEVMGEGAEVQKQEARRLLDSIG